MTRGEFEPLDSASEDEWRATYRLLRLAEEGLAEALAGLLGGPAGRLVDRCDKLGRTPLYVASVCARFGCCELLLAAGADASARDYVGFPACRYGAEAEDLLEAGEGERGVALFTAYGARWLTDRPRQHTIQITQRRGDTAATALGAPGLFRGSALRRGLAVRPDDTVWSVRGRVVMKYTAPLWLTEAEAGVVRELLRGLKGTRGIEASRLTADPE